MKRMEEQIAELQNLVLQLMGGRPAGGEVAHLGGVAPGATVLPGPGSKVMGFGSTAKMTHCLSCDQPIINANRFQVQPGHSLGGGYQLRSPTRKDPANPTLPEIDREAFFDAQREAASTMYGAEGVNGMLYKPDPQHARGKPQRRSKSANRQHRGRDDPSRTNTGVAAGGAAGAGV